MMIMLKGSSMSTVFRLTVVVPKTIYRTFWHSSSSTLKPSSLPLLSSFRTNTLVCRNSFSSTTTTNDSHQEGATKNKVRTRVHRYNIVNDNDDDDDGDDEDDRHRLTTNGTVLVMGCCGSLGQVVSKYLSTEMKMSVIGADVVVPPAGGDNNGLDAFIEMPLPSSPSSGGGMDTYLQPPPSLVDTTSALVDGLAQLLDDDADGDDGSARTAGFRYGGSNINELTAIVCVAGGWEGDPMLPPPNADVETLLDGAQQYASTIERMTSKNLYPLLAAGYASNYFLTDDNGLFVAIGATAALGPTPGMVGYGLSKSSTHHFIQTIGELTESSVTTKSKRKLAQQIKQENRGAVNTRMSVIGILPTTIDTPMNRQAMPHADFGQWTKSIDIAKQIGDWIERPVFRPHSGSLVKVFPKSDGNGAVFQLAR